MKKRSKKLLALLTTAAMAVMMVSSVVSAATNPYEPVYGTSFSFDKHLVVPKDMSIPGITFEFEIEYGEAVAGNADNVRIYAGNDGNRVEITTKPSIAPVTFEENQDTEDGKANDGIANDTDHKYATETVTVDFSGVKYKEPGVYRYIIKEKNLQQGAVYDTTPRTLDVTVINGDEDGELEIEGYTMYYGKIGSSRPKVDNTQEAKEGADTTIEDGKKCKSFVNSYPATSLSVGKVVSGNQASKDQYFRFTV